MPPSPECLIVIHTGHRRRDEADDRIVELVHEQPDLAASLVYTSDAKLRTRGGEGARHPGHGVPDVSGAARYGERSQRANSHRTLARRRR